MVTVSQNFFGDRECTGWKSGKIRLGKNEIVIKFFLRLYTNYRIRLQVNTATQWNYNINKIFKFEKDSKNFPSILVGMIKLSDFQGTLKYTIYQK